MSKSKLLREIFLVREDGAVPVEIDAADTRPTAAPPSARSQPMTQGLRVSGDKVTLGALQDALQEAASSIHDNQDLSEWCERAYNAVAMGIRRGGGSVTLPAYSETPDIDSFNDDESGVGPDPDEEI